MSHNYTVVLDADDYGDDRLFSRAGHLVPASPFVRFVATVAVAGLGVALIAAALVASDWSERLRSAARARALRRAAARRPRKKPKAETRDPILAALGAVEDAVEAPAVLRYGDVRGVVDAFGRDAAGPLRALAREELDAFGHYESAGLGALSAGLGAPASPRSPTKISPLWQGGEAAMTRAELAREHAPGGVVFASKHFHVDKYAPDDERTVLLLRRDAAKPCEVFVSSRDDLCAARSGVHFAAIRREPVRFRKGQHAARVAVDPAAARSTWDGPASFSLVIDGCGRSTFDLQHWTTSKIVAIDEESPVETPVSYTHLTLPTILLV